MDWVEVCEIWSWFEVDSKGRPIREVGPRFTKNCQWIWIDEGPRGVVNITDEGGGGDIGDPTGTVNASGGTRSDAGKSALRKAWEAIKSILTNPKVIEECGELILADGPTIEALLEGNFAGAALEGVQILRELIDCVEATGVIDEGKIRAARFFADLLEQFVRNIIDEIPVNHPPPSKGGFPFPPEPTRRKELPPVRDPLPQGGGRTGRTGRMPEKRPPPKQLPKKN